MTNEYGINISLAELIRARPAKGVTGFAPSGRVTTHQWGGNASMFKGRGMEFAESRIYQESDDIRHIDWRVTARTGMTHTKLYQEERERPVQILLDLRFMMQFGTRVRFKSHLAAEVAAQFAWVAFDGGDRIGGQILTQTGIKDFRLARTRKAVLRFLEGISDETQQQSVSYALDDNVGVDVSLSMGLARLRKVCRPGTLVFVISDFHDFDHQTSQEIIRLGHHAHVTCVQINDVLDASLPACEGRVTDGELMMSLATLGNQQRDDYAAEYLHRQQLLSQTCAKNGMSYHHLYTTDSAASLLTASGNHQRGGR
ncbi:MAG: DUF58 domain-containing protein [Gammaproteobacteria bacterium]|nr:DUF58 domain-containing protein [Gammaproteobacteria bacterium]